MSTAIGQMSTPYVKGNFYYTKHRFALISRVSQKGFTLVPLSIYFKRGIAKVEIAVVKGKQHFDKRESIKKKEARREISRAIKEKGQPS